MTLRRGGEGTRRRAGFGLAEGSGLMLPVVLLVTTLAVPAVVAALVFVGSRRLARRAVSAAGEDASVPLALGLGYAAAQASSAWPAFPPIDVTDRVVWLALVSVISGVVAAVAVPRLLRWGNALGLAALVIGGVVGPIFGSTAEPWRDWGWVGLLVLAFVAAGANLDRLSTGLGAWPLGIPLVLTAFGSAVALAVSGSLVLGRFSASLGVALATVAALTGGLRLGAGLALPCCAILGALLVGGYAYVESGLPALSAVLLAASPAAAWTARIPALARRSAWVATLATSLVTLIPVVAAVVIAVP